MLSQTRKRPEGIAINSSYFATAPMGSVTLLAKLQTGFLTQYAVTVAKYTNVQLNQCFPTFSLTISPVCYIIEKVILFKNIGIAYILCCFRGETYMAEKFSIEYIWKDRKRILGMPISFTRYAMSEDRLFYSKGLFNTVEKEIMLYRVKDISVNRTLWQKLFGVGSIIVESSDSDLKHFEIKNIKNTTYVKELLHKQVEKKKDEKGMSITEFIDNGAPNPMQGKK